MQTGRPLFLVGYSDIGDPVTLGPFRPDQIEERVDAMRFLIENDSTQIVLIEADDATDALRQANRGYTGPRQPRHKN